MKKEIHRERTSIMGVHVYHMCPTGTNSQKSVKKDRQPNRKVGERLEHTPPQRYSRGP